MSFRNTPNGIVSDRGFRIREFERNLIRYEEESRSASFLVDMSADGTWIHIGWPAEVHWDSREPISSSERSRLRSDIGDAYTAIGMRVTFDDQGVQP